LETLPNYHQFINILFRTITYFAKVATLNLHHVGKQQNNVSYPFPWIMVHIFNTCNFSTSYKKGNQQQKKFKQFYHNVFKIIYIYNEMDTTMTIFNHINIYQLKINTNATNS
jgi:hypothetical protein